MKSGNIPEKLSIEVEYVACSLPPFNDASCEKKVLFNPHQTPGFNGKSQYKPINFQCDTISINCVCLSKFNIIDELMKKYKLSNNILWLDPKGIPLECLASILYNWYNNAYPHANLALGIIVPHGETQLLNEEYRIWKPDVSGSIFVDTLLDPIWYPSLARDRGLLLKNSYILNPYDVYPLIDFSTFITQMGERNLTDHSMFLEQSRTRTRHFVYFDVEHPKQAFNQFYNTLKIIPSSALSILQPVLTPGGSPIEFIVTLLAGVFSRVHFFTPQKEIPMSINEETTGIIMVRKVY